MTSPPTPDRTSLEALVEAGQIESVLLLKGEFTDAERALIQRTYEAVAAMYQAEVERLRGVEEAARGFVKTCETFRPDQHFPWADYLNLREAMERPL